MLNYILADYKRIINRIPRLILLVIYESALIFFVLNKWSDSAGNFNSVALLQASSWFFDVWFQLILCPAAFIHSFSYDFKAKTIQSAIGIGITRLQVILCKLTQMTLVMITDFLVTFGTFGILCIITKTPMTGHQILNVVYNGMGYTLFAISSICLVLPLILRTQNMIMGLFGYYALTLGALSDLLRWISRLGPIFLARLQLDQLTHDSCAKLVITNAINGQFQLKPWIGVIIWFVIGIYLAWLSFRKMELDL